MAPITARIAVFCGRVQPCLRPTARIAVIPNKPSRAGFLLSQASFSSLSSSGFPLVRRSETLDRLQTESRVTFASSRRNKKGSNHSKILANEHLIKDLLDRNPRQSIESMKVRMTIRGEGESESEVVSLSKAIDTSIERGMDLVEGNLSNNPPIVLIAKLAGIMIRKEKEGKKQRATGPQNKSFKFRTGIADHDKDRKITDMQKFLEKKASCQISIYVKRNSSTDEGMELAKSIEARLEKVGQLRKAPSANEQGNYITAAFDPISQKKKP